MDETFIGGKHKNKRIKGTQGRSVKYKSAVFGMIERGGGLIAKVVPNTQTQALMPHILENVKDTAFVMTDEWLAYNSLWKLYNHEKVKHKIGEYVNGRIHTNTIEGFLAWLKRTVLGMYYWVSWKHLQKIFR